jgi:hypothetical protein
MKKIYFILFFILFFYINLFAGGQGTTIFQTLQLPLTAYEASVANTFISGTDSALNNPSILPFTKNSVILSHAIYLADTNYTVLGGNYNINEKSSINFTFSYFNYGSMDRYIEDPISGYIKQGSFDANDKLFSISYARNINNKVSYGITLKYISQNIDDVSYNGYALHLSGLYFINSNAFILTGLNNIGPKVKDYNLPVNFYLGLAGYLKEQLLLVGQLDNYYNDSITELKLALEYELIKIFSCRFGYVIPIKKEFANENEFLTNLTLGVGLKFSIVDIDYAWLPKGDLGAVHMFSLTYKFN